MADAARSGLFAFLARSSIQRPRAWLSVLLVITCVLAVGLTRLRTEFGYRVLLGDDHPSIQALDQFIAEFGGGLPVKIAWECGDGFPCQSAVDAVSLSMAHELTRKRDGDRVTAAGAVIVRQRPGTAKGFVFLTMEDETGMLQAIVRPDLFREQRAVVVGSGALVVKGKLQRQDGSLSVKAEHFWTIPEFAKMPSHDFR